MTKADLIPVTEARYLAFLIMEAARLQRTVFDRRVRKIGFTRTQWMALRRVGDQPGVNQSELAELPPVASSTNWKTSVGLSDAKMMQIVASNGSI